MAYSKHIISEIVEDIKSGEFGRVEHSGSTWQARAAAGQKILKGENFLKNENQTIRHLKRKEKIELANWLANSHNIQGKESEYGKSWEYEIAETYGGK